MNNLAIIGRMVRNPELRRTQNDIAVASFRIAVDREYSEGTDFFDVVAWRKTGEFVSKYFKQGQKIAIVGRIQTREWEDKDGNKRRNVEIIAEHVDFAGDKKNENASSKMQELPDDMGGELPFKLGDDEELPL